MTHTNNTPEPQKPRDIYGEIYSERIRAHAKHGDTSMESQPVDALLRLAVLAEEVGEVAKEFNEARHEGRGVDLVRLRKELIQTAAMATAWADACSGTVRELESPFERGVDELAKQIKSKG